MFRNGDLPSKIKVLISYHKFSIILIFFSKNNTIFRPKYRLEIIINKKIRKYWTISIDMLTL